MSRLTFTHRRSAWVGNVPLTGPGFDWSTIDFVVVHYPGHGGVPDGDPGEHASDLPGFIRRAHEAAVRVRGYSYYYGVLVDWLGGTWEVRGDEFRNAANAPAAFNTRSIAIQVMVDVGSDSTEAQDDAVADLIAQIRRIRPNVTVIGHIDGPQHFAAATRTACPGDMLLAKLRAGRFDHTGTQPPVSSPYRPGVPLPLPTLYDNSIGTQGDALRGAMGFWGWANIREMQRALGVTVDGQYGPVTAAAYGRWLDTMETLAATPPATPAVSIHTVADGETMSSIARLYDVHVNELASINRMPRPADTIRRGDRFAIPGRSVRVASGKGWYDAARAAGVTEAALRAANPTVTKLYPDTILLDPRAAA